MPIRIQAPDGSIVEFPDGTQDAVIEQAMRATFGAGKDAQGQSAPPQNVPAPNSGYWGGGSEAMDLFTAGLASKGNAALSGLMDAGIGAAKGEGWNYSDNYNKWLNWQRENQRLYNEEHPVRAAAGKAGGIALGVTQLPMLGRGLMGAAGTGGLYGAIAGAGGDANSLPERATNTVSGALTGAGIGGAGYGLGRLMGMGADKASRAWQSLNAPAETRAAMEIRALADDAGGVAALKKALDDLGPDAMTADVFGEKGLAVSRQMANINPEARDILEASVLGRKGQQNARLATDIESIAGVKPGEGKTVKELTGAIDEKFRPELDRLYSQARAAGKDMPLQFFNDVLKTPQGASVFKEAEAAVKARASLKGTPEDISNLAIIDEMKKIFDSKATSSYANADNAAGGLWRDFAKNLRTRADSFMDMQENPIYAEARALGQQAAKAKEAVALGESLGNGRVPRDLPKNVEKVDLGNRQRLAQGYAAKKTDSLLNRNSTEGAINEFYTPMGKKAAEASLGPGALDKSLSRERTFNRTAKALTGNSTTARQLVEMGLGGTAAGAAATYLTGDPLQGGVAGILAALTRKGAPFIAKKLATDAQKSAAPHIAKMLIGRNIPAEISQLTPGTLEKLSKAGRDKLVKALLLTAADGLQTRQAATGPR